MPPTEPPEHTHIRNALHDTYLRAKRYLSFFSGALFLAILVGAMPSSGTSHFPWTIDRPDHWLIVLYGAVFYYLFQFRLFWDAQPEPVKAVPQHKFDYRTNLIIGVLALFSLPLTYAVQFPWIETLINCLSKSWRTSGWNTFALTVWVLVLLASPLFFVLNYGRLFRSKIEDEHKREAELSANIENELLNNTWRLVFNPAHYSKSPDTTSKEMRFVHGGEIVLGKNKNESAWRLNGEFLEILNSSGNVFSRFRYNKDAKVFQHTNDEDTLSIKGQYMHISGATARD